MIICLGWTMQVPTQRKFPFSGFLLSIVDKSERGRGTAAAGAVPGPAPNGLKIGIRSGVGSIACLRMEFANDAGFRGRASRSGLVDDDGWMMDDEWGVGVPPASGPNG